MTTRGLGSTEVGPVVGLYRDVPELTKYATAADVYMRHCCKIEKPQNAAMLRGIEAEPRLRRTAQEAYGWSPEPKPEKWVVRHPVHTWASVSPDDVVSVNGQRTLVEYKSSSLFSLFPPSGAPSAWGDSDTEDLPPVYLLQCQWGMEILNLPEAHLFVGFGKDVKNEGGKMQFFYSETRRYVIKRDKELAEICIKLCERFMMEHIFPRIPPNVEPRQNKLIWKKLLKERNNDRSKLTGAANNRRSKESSERPRALSNAANGVAEESR